MKNITGIIMFHVHFTLFMYMRYETTQNKTSNVKIYTYFQIIYYCLFFTFCNYAFISVFFVQTKHAYIYLKNSIF